MQKIEPELIHLGPKNIDFNPTNAYIVLEASVFNNTILKLIYVFEGTIPLRKIQSNFSMQRARKTWYIKFIT